MTVLHSLACISVTDQVTASVEKALLYHQAPIAILCKVGDEVTFLHIELRLRVVDDVRRLNRLAVALEDPARPPLRGHLGDILLGGFTTARPLRWTRAPQHRVGVLPVSCHVGYVRTATSLIEAIDSLLEVSFVLFIAFRRLMCPEQARLLRPLLIILECLLAFDE